MPTQTHTYWLEDTALSRLTVIGWELGRGVSRAAALLALAVAAVLGPVHVWAQAPIEGQSTPRVFIMRHALAPGYGDPDHIRMGDCSTQRNLSDAGRVQAQRAGAWLRSQGLGATDTVVFTSPWCRTTQTAQLLDLGTPQPSAGLASFFQQGSRAQTLGELQALLATVMQPAGRLGETGDTGEVGNARDVGIADSGGGAGGGGAAYGQAGTAGVAAQGAGGRAPRHVVLVTHQVNIQALTGLGAASGELLELQLSPTGAFERVLVRHVPAVP
jgi:hypothetical protein